MCRLFGFRSIINSQVHSSLVSADNTLHDLSQRHPDGWGVAYFLENTPHLIKSTDCAMEDQLFQKVSGVVSSQTVIAHIRKATQGSHSILNSHPFQYGKWVFAHNGNIKNFNEVKNDLLNLIDDDLKRYILGSTDSEVFFFILLSNIKELHSLDDPDIEPKLLKDAINKTIYDVINIIGQLNHNNKPVETENYLSFLLTSGSVMVGFNGGQDIFSCTYKKSCPEKETCPSYAKYCEAAPDSTGKVNHLIFASERISGPNVWNLMQPGEIFGVDKEMQVFKSQMNLTFIEN